MNVYITENEIYQIFRATIVAVSSCIGVQDIDWKTNKELFEEIRIKNIILFDLLDKHLFAYRAWTDFIHKNKDREAFDIEEQKRLGILMHQRDSTRSQLVTAIKQITNP